jgi:hypothetical protein
MTGKTEDEMIEYYNTHPNIKKLKNQLNDFFKENAIAFSKEFKTTHFMGFSAVFKKEMTETKVGQQILSILTGLKQFDREILNFIINVEDLGTMAFENSLKVEADVDELYKEARKILKITPEV